MDKKLCVLFPGIGYHCEKPLLYYAAKLAVSAGYEVMPLKFSGFDKAADAASHAVRLSCVQLSDTDFSLYRDIVFAKPKCTLSGFHLA